MNLAAERSAAATRRQASRLAAPTVLKIGGELLDGDARMRQAAASIAALASDTPLVVVHGGGREIDGELARRGIEKQMVDGIRITDGPTLDTVIAVLAGTMNTGLVASLAAAGVAAVGLTGADASIGLCTPAPPLGTQDGRAVHLGLVGYPSASAPMRLITDLCRNGYVPVIASLGVSGDGRLFNLNADTFAAHLASALEARRLLIAGTTRGVLDDAGRTLPEVDGDLEAALIASGAAHAGMVAKLTACRYAVRSGVPEVLIFDGRESLDPTHGPVTQVVSTATCSHG